MIVFVLLSKIVVVLLSMIIAVLFCLPVHLSFGGRTILSRMVVPRIGLNAPWKKWNLKNVKNQIQERN